MILLNRYDLKQILYVLFFSLKKDGSSLITSGRIGTPSYMSPEVVQRMPYAKPADIWSCGVVLFVLLSGSLPFVGSNRRIFELISQGNYLVRYFNKYFKLKFKFLFRFDKKKDETQTMGPHI